MNPFKEISKRLKINKIRETTEGNTYEYCPRCDANLTLQKGYRSNLPYWLCRGCGEMLINPVLDSDDDVVWVCDQCGTVLNIQDGFPNHGAEWACTECGFVNKIEKSEIYVSEDEFQAEKHNPYKGLTDEEALALAGYREIVYLENRPNIILVEQPETGRRYVKKLLNTYNRSIYDYLKDHPVAHMPRIQEIYESANCLIVIEEFVEGSTIAEILEETILPEDRAIEIGIEICRILNDLHNLSTPIIHRDIKPSNIMISQKGEVILLDVNVAKWYEPDKNADTRYMGTENYAAPEQAGYGLAASSPKSDVYALGVLLNVMTTGHLPKEERANGKLWDVIEHCISLDAKNRYEVAELQMALEELRGALHATETNNGTE